MKTGKDLVDEARRRIKEVSASEALEMKKRGDDIIFLDVREPNEWNLGRIPGALHIPRGNLESKVEGMIDRARAVLVYCSQGSRSTLAADTMMQMGYLRVASISDGWAGWVGADGDVDD